MVFLSGAFGVFIGISGGYIFGSASPKCISILQGTGTCILLWGTLFVRGYEITTNKGQSFIEKVNQLIYRTLYCIGTVVLVSSVFLPTA